MYYNVKLISSFIYDFQGVIYSNLKNIYLGKPPLKSDCHLPKKFLFTCFNERPLKMIKNAFYFIFKDLFVLKIFKFLS